MKLSYTYEGYKKLRTPFRLLILLLIILIPYFIAIFIRGNLQNELMFSFQEIKSFLVIYIIISIIIIGIDFKKELMDKKLKKNGEKNKGTIISIHNESSKSSIGYTRDLIFSLLGIGKKGMINIILNNKNYFISNIEINDKYKALEKRLIENNNEEIVVDVYTYNEKIYVDLKSVNI